MTVRFEGVAATDVERGRFLPGDDCGHTTLGSADWGVALGHTGSTMLVITGERAEILSALDGVRADLERCDPFAEMAILIERSHWLRVAAEGIEESLSDRLMDIEMAVRGLYRAPCGYCGGEVFAAEGEEVWDDGYSHCHHYC